jgi:hypothetical protein
LTRVQPGSLECHTPLMRSRAPRSSPDEHGAPTTLPHGRRHLLRIRDGVAVVRQRRCQRDGQAVRGPWVGWTTRGGLLLPLGGVHLVSPPPTARDWCLRPPHGSGRRVSIRRSWRRMLHHQQLGRGAGLGLVSGVGPSRLDSGRRSGGHLWPLHKPPHRPPHELPHRVRTAVGIKPKRTGSKPARMRSNPFRPRPLLQRHDIYTVKSVFRPCKNRSTLFLRKTSCTLHVRT